METTNDSTKFNIFEILSKDDKELIHSAFVKFLITENDLFYKLICKITDSDIKYFIGIEPELEKSYKSSEKDISGKSINKRYRFDIQVKHEEKNNDKKKSVDSFLIIENKFKSFPYKQQLQDYEKIIKKEYPNCKRIYKILICFDKKYAPSLNDWLVVDYSEILRFLKDQFINIKNCEKRIFINHYVSFLELYIDDYKKYINNPSILLDDKKEIKDKNFWLKLLYSAIGNTILKNNNTLFSKIQLGSGSTTLALVEFFPEKWYNEFGLLIQLQGSKLKLYCHPKENKKDFYAEFIGISKKLIEKKYLGFNVSFKTPNEKHETYYLLQLNILDLCISEAVNIDILANKIIQFYDEINSLMKN